MCCLFLDFFFFFKQKTAYEMRISDWSSDVCSSDLNAMHRAVKAEGGWGGICTESCSIHPEVNQSLSTCTTLWDEGEVINHRYMTDEEIGRASCRERVCQYV